MRELKNIGFLGVSHACNFVVPIVMLPYLANALGVEVFGDYSLIVAIINYGILISDFGFSFTATSIVSKNRDDKFYIYDFVLNVFVLKFTILIIISLLVFFIWRVFFSDWSTFVFAFILLAISFYCLTPYYFFQGVESLKGITLSLVFFKLLSVLLVVLFVNDENDFALAVFLYSMSFIFPFFFSILILKRMGYKVKKINFKKNEMLDLTKASLPLFFSSFLTSGYTTANVFIVAYLTSPEILGVYALADRLKSALQASFNPIRQAIYPRACVFVAKQNFSYVLKIYGIPLILFGVLLNFSVYIFSENLIDNFFGEEFYDSVELFKLFSFAYTFVAVSTLFGHWVVIASGETRNVFYVYLCSLAVHLIYVFPLTSFYGGYGMVVSVLLTEFLVMLSFVFLGVKIIESKKLQ